MEVTDMTGGNSMDCTPKTKKEKDADLDEALDESFPASDPPDLTPKPECDEAPVPARKKPAAP